MNTFYWFEYLWLLVSLLINNMPINSLEQRLKFGCCLRIDDSRNSNKMPTFVAMAIANNAKLATTNKTVARCESSHFVIVVSYEFQGENTI